MYEYYTPIGLAKELLRLVNRQRFDEAIDICCGSWNLLQAANEMFQIQQITGVDISEKARENIIDGGLFYKRDGIDYATQICHKKKFDLVLSNPPYGHISKINDCMRDLIDNEYQDILKKRYENEMLVANMLLVKEKGVLLAILPYTFVFGDSNVKARRAIANLFHISSIIALPLGAFRNKEIKTCAVIMEKDNKEDGTSFYTANFHGNRSNWKLRYKTKVEREYICQGKWGSDFDDKIIDCAKNVFRGTISSSSFCDDGCHEVLHCSSNYHKGIWRPSRKKCSDDVVGKVAKKNDILINRVGKGAGYWCINKDNKYMVSDCIIVVRPKTGNETGILKKHSRDGRIDISLRGVSVRYISISDVIKLLYSKC